MDPSQFFTPDFAWLALALLASGVVAGVTAGLLGVGGGIVVVPVLFHVFGLIGVDETVRMQMAVGTSLATIIPTSISSTLSHHKRGAINFEIVRNWAPGILLGVVVGSLIIRNAEHQWLTGFFATVALLLAANMAFAKEEWRLSDSLPARWVQTSISTVMGTVSTLMGIGGGTMGVTLMTLFGIHIRNAVATSAGLGLVIGVPAAIGFVINGWSVPDRPAGSLGYVNLVGFAFIVPATILMAPIGAKIAHSISRKALLRAFAIFLALTSFKMFYDILS